MDKVSVTIWDGAEDVKRAVFETMDRAHEFAAQYRESHREVRGYALWKGIKYVGYYEF